MQRSFHLSQLEDTIARQQSSRSLRSGLAVMRDVKARLDARGIAVDLERCVAREKADGRLLLGDPEAVEAWRDPEVWQMIARGHGRAVHHIESPAMTSLCRMCNVHEIDGLVAIVSVIRLNCFLMSRGRAIAP